MSLEARAKAYVAELHQNRLHSTSHWTLLRMVQDYGQAAVDAALEPYWQAEREAIATHEAETVRKFYAQFNPE